MVVWAVASDEHDNGEALAAFIEYCGVEMPVLVDEGGEVHRLYEQENPFPPGPFPQQWIVGADGRIAYRHNEFEYDAVVAVLEAELAEQVGPARRDRQRCRAQAGARRARSVLSLPGREEELS